MQKNCHFYRAMHFSAKRGLAIACRLSVRPSVTLVNCDHIGWNSSAIMSTLLAQSDPHPVDLSVGDIRSQIAAEWLQIAQRSQWIAYRKPTSLFQMVPSLTPYGLLPPQKKMGVPCAPMIRGRLKMREWKMRYGQKCKGGKCRNGKCDSR